MGLSPTVSEINGNFSPKSQTALCILHSDKAVLLGFREIGYQRLRSKTRIMALPGGERCLMISLTVRKQCSRSTRTWRTNGRTDTGRQQTPR